MNKRKSILETGRNSNQNKNSDDTNIRIVIEIIKRYLAIYDIDKNTMHSQVFKMLYLSEKFYTYKDICNTLYISKNTLVRYIGRYNNLAINILNKLDKRST